MRAVGEIENPQHGHICRSGILVSSDRPIQPTFSKLWFAFGLCVHVCDVSLQNINSIGNNSIGLGEMIWRNEIQIVRRCVILGNFPELTALEKSNRQIKAWRTKLTFVVPVGAEIENGRHQS